MEWYRTLCAHLVSEGFRVGKNDPCVYVNPIITKVRLVVVVDDILCRGSRQATEAFYTSLAARFKVQEPTFLTRAFIITYCGLGISLTETPTITSELKEVERHRLTQLTPEEIAAIPRGTAVRLRMRLVRKKDGRFKARLLVQGFRIITVLL